MGVTTTYKPDISAAEYPIMDTHPKSSEELLIEAAENDPDFWNNDLDDAEDMGSKYGNSMSIITHLELYFTLLIAIRQAN